jgi:hypothetical protein
MVVITYYSSYSTLVLYLLVHIQSTIAPFAYQCAVLRVGSLPDLTNLIE